MCARQNASGHHSRRSISRGGSIGVVLESCHAGTPGLLGQLSIASMFVVCNQEMPLDR